MDFAVVVLFGMILGIPFYCVTLLAFQYASAWILRLPFFWCVGIPLLLLVTSVLAFPPERLHGILWVVLIPLSALFAGTMFYVWLRRSPLSRT